MYHLLCNSVIRYFILFISHKYVLIQWELYFSVKNRNPWSHNKSTDKRGVDFNNGNPLYMEHCLHLGFTLFSSLMKEV